MIQFQILPGGFPVYQAYEGDAGFDLATPETFYLFPGEAILLDLKIATKIPKHWVGLLTNRSSLAAKHGCVANTGIIDSGYIGPLKLKLFNHSDEIQTFEKGDRIAQLVVVPFYAAGFEYVEQLEPTERGTGGLGSSGK